MDPAELGAAITAAMHGTTFALAADTLGPATAPVGRLLSSLFEPARLRVEGGSARVDDGAARIRGTLTSTPVPGLAPFAGFEVEATFTLDASRTPQLQLVLAPDRARRARWGPADLPGGRPHAVWSAFAWSDARFAFDSAAPASLPDTFPADYGFDPGSSGSAPRASAVFAANVAYRGDSACLSWIFGDGALRVEGPVEWHADQLLFDLRSAPLPAFTLGRFAWTASLHLIACRLSFARPGGGGAVVWAMPAAILVGTLTAGAESTGRMALPFRAQLPLGDGGSIRAVARPDQPVAAGLVAVADILGVPDLSGARPAGPSPLADLDAVSLETLELVVEPTRARVLLAAATLSYAAGSAWSPFGGALLTFHDLAVTFAAIEPTSALHLQTTVAARARLAGGTLEATISLPGLDFRCDLLDGERAPVDLTDVLDDITGQVASQLGSTVRLRCSALRVTGDLATPSMRLAGTLDDALTIDAFAAPFELTTVVLDVTRRGGPAPSTAGRIAALMSVGEVVLHVSAAVGGDARGWRFQGESTGGLAIRLDRVVAAVVAVFGGDVGAWLPEITVRRCSAMFETDTRDFAFGLDGDIELLGHTLSVGVDLGRTREDPADGDAVTWTFEAWLQVGGAAFRSRLGAGSASRALTFEWEADEAGLDLAGLAAAFGFGDLPSLPLLSDVSITTASISYDFEHRALLLRAASAAHGEVVLVAAPPGVDGAGALRLARLQIGAGLSLEELPVLGELVSGPDELGIRALELRWSSRPVTAAAAASVIERLASTGPPLPPTLAAAWAGGLELGATFVVGGRPLTLPPLDADVGRAAAPAAAGSVSVDGADAAAAPTDGMSWLSVGRAAGPVRIERLGLGFRDGGVSIGVDGGFTAGPVGMSVRGLRVRSPLRTFAPRFELDGLGLALRTAQLTIAGALVAVPDDELAEGEASRFDGAVVLGTGRYTLSGVGSYGRLVGADGGAGDATLFGFAEYDGRIGGPAFFYVIGLMAGFGYNRRLVIPTPEEVTDFPFVRGLDAAPAPAGGIGRAEAAPTTPMRLLGILDGTLPADGRSRPKRWLETDPGAFWLAVGVRATTYQLVDSRLLAVVSVGRRVEIDLIGRSQLVLPRPRDMRSAPVAGAMVNIELGVLAHVVPDEGRLEIDARIDSASFVFDPQCTLTGGAALYAWFGASPHSGDFVLTVGGYHPRFPKPAHYPDVPRVGFNWKRSDRVTLKGRAYMALTPAAVMAGGALELSYEDGDLRAWFRAWADFLMYWEPLRYSIALGVTIGASYRLRFLGIEKTFRVELGADVELWGPPFAGRATVRWWVISFTVPLGAGERPPLTPLSWDAFAARCLPADGPLSVRIGRGLRPDANPPGSAGRAPDRAPVVDPDALLIVTGCHVPSTAVRLNGAAVATPPAGPFGIRPMNAALTRAVHDVWVEKAAIGGADGPDWIPLEPGQVRAEVDLGAVPRATWSATPVPSRAEALGGAPTIADTPVGLTLAPPIPVLDALDYTDPIDRDDLAFGSQDVRDHFDWSTPEPRALLDVGGPDGIADAAVGTARRAYIAELRASGLTLPDDVTLADTPRPFRPLSGSPLRARLRARGDRS